MRSSYKKLGQYIEIVNERNKNLEVDRLLGVSIQKVLMPSIANTVGTDMSKYKIIRKKQFAYGPVTSRNGDKISVALLLDFPNAIISQAYTVFKIIDHNKLDPEYLMMWFRRPEFDRYARFKSHGSARETFDWDEMCGVELPVPSIEKQRAIVKEYNTVINRIKLNEQLNQKLEATAQALYKHWFVDFEFPNEDGHLYKSSGGKMVWNEELEKEIPEGWEVDNLGEVCDVLDYKRKPLSGEERNEMKGNYPYYGAMSIMDYVNDFLFDGIYLLISEDGVNVIDKNGHPSLQYVWGRFWVNNHAHILKGNSLISTEFLFLSLKNTNVADLVTGAAQPKINQKNMCSIKIILPKEHILSEFNRIISNCFSHIRNTSEVSVRLIKLRHLLLLSLSKENEKVLTVDS